MTHNHLRHAHGDDIKKVITPRVSSKVDIITHYGKCNNDRSAFYHSGRNATVALFPFCKQHFQENV